MRELAELKHFTHENNGDGKRKPEGKGHCEGLQDSPPFNTGTVFPLTKKKEEKREQ